MTFTGGEVLPCRLQGCQGGNERRKKNYLSVGDERGEGQTEGDVVGKIASEHKRADHRRPASSPLVSYIPLQFSNQASQPIPQNKPR
jgi:hypothetical protein